MNFVANAEGGVFCGLRLQDFTAKARLTAVFMLAVLLLMLTSVAAVAIGNTRFSLGGDSSVTRTVVQVQAGDTLWSLARKHLPDVDADEAVFQIQQLNDLRSDQLTAGESIRIPRVDH